MHSRFLKILGAVAVINIISRLLGFAREVVIGYQYGTTSHADSIISAFTIPNFLYIVVGGAITTAFISVYTKLEKERKDTFVQTIFSGLALLMGSATLVFFLFPEFWMNVFFSGMSGEAVRLTSELFRWMAPATFFLTMAMILSGIHNVNDHYRISTFGALIFNAVFLILGAGLTFIMGEYAYGLGALIGSILMFSFLLYFVLQKKLAPIKFRLYALPEMKRFVKLALPIMFGGATIQFYFLIQRMFASHLEEGVISAMNYASKMTQFPQAVLMTSVTTIVYPMLSKAVGENDFDKVKRAYQKGFRMLFILLIPASIFIFMYAEDIIRFIFQYGNFSMNSTERTYPLLQIFSLSVLSLALNTYVTRFFYAMENSWIPILLNVISVFGVNILVIWLLIDQYEAKAIAIGTVIATMVNLLLLVILAKRKLGLVVSSWREMGKLLPFLCISTFFIILSGWIPISAPVFSLLAGGGVTLIFIIAGFYRFRS
ncbi:murein biosynthesis integral membrane protein MurJ [Salinibacillus aidingensis]|uniref:Lipid II flippase n=1 Tax=Salinibacillus aidingensis TaxID=237684 RepID=A0ABN1B0L4_9BACI